MGPICKGLWRSGKFGWFFSVTLLLGAVLARWRICSAGGDAILDTKVIPSFAVIGLGTFGVVSFSLGMLNTKRFQRAEDLIRELTLVREPMHPDYRKMQRLDSGWTAKDGNGGIDPRWVDKHERTVKTIARFREYRQLFIGLPVFATITTLAFTVLVGVTALFWLLSMGFHLRWLAVLQLIPFALTMEFLVQLLWFLWQVTLFPERGTDERLESRLGIPSWYSLLDVQYLSRRFLPFAQVVANHESYFALSREPSDIGEQWQIALQLPIPLRGWEWRCRVWQHGSLCSQGGWERVDLTPEVADRFFREPGLWLQIPVARWGCDRTKPYEFGDVRVCLDLRCPGDRQQLRLTVPVTEGDESWFKDSEPRDVPLRYPWYAIEYVDAADGEPTPGNRWLVHPPVDTGTL